MASKKTITFECDLCGAGFAPSEYSGRSYERPEWGGQVRYEMMFDSYGNGVSTVNGPKVLDLCFQCNTRVKNALTPKKKEG
jgi:hypothetical protein